MMLENKQDNTTQKIDGSSATVRKMLLVTMIASIVLLVLGIVRYLADPALQEPARSLADYWTSLRHFQPLGLFFAGLAMLTLGPVTGVLAATLAFFARGDRRYALVALGVLLIVLATLFLAH
ncbi:MAG TPA: DUF1634 domain-containing protein [Armatimonadota bacterium]|jgi:uncharacterized membrane protein